MCKILRLQAPASTNEKTKPIQLFIKHGIKFIDILREQNNSNL